MWVPGTTRPAAGWRDQKEAMGGFMSADDILTFAVNHYVVFGLVTLCFGIGLNLLFRCGPDLIEAIRHPRLH
jgi:hypothetical protein